MQQTTRSGPLRMGFHLGLPGPVHAWLSPCLVALTLLAGAGCGGSGGGSSSSGGTTPGVISTGTVSLAMSDTPFADLQTFTLELSRATLKGAGTAADLQLFPVGGTQASSLDVDMLQLIGVNRLLGTAQVPVGFFRTGPGFWARTLPPGKSFLTSDHGRSFLIVGNEFLPRSPPLTSTL